MATSAYRVHPPNAAARAVECRPHERERRRRLLAGLYAVRARRAHHLPLGVKISVATGFFARNTSPGGFPPGCSGGLGDGFGVLKLQIRGDGGDP